MERMNDEPSGYMLTNGRTIWQFVVNDKVTSVVSLARARKTMNRFFEDGITEYKIVAIHELSDEQVPA